MLHEGVIAEEDLDLILHADNVDEAMSIIKGINKPV
jgi:hypothetical protein